MRDVEKITLVIAPTLESGEQLCRDYGIPRETYRDSRTMRFVTRADALRGWRDGTACLIDFSMFDHEHLDLRNMAQALLSQNRIRHANFNERRALRGEVV